MRALNAGLVCLLLFTGPLLQAKEPQPVFDIPRLEAITVDGKPADWGDRGFQVNILASEKGLIKAAADLDTSFSLGWDPRGLLLKVTVTDDVPDEGAGEFWLKDSVEIFYSPRRGSPEVLQVVASPGIDPKYPELRWNFNDQRKSDALKKIQPSGSFTRTRIKNGYILEGLLAWENLGLKAEPGQELAFQLYVNDSNGGNRFQVRWYPEGAAADSTKMYTLRLSDKPSPPVNAVATSEYERLRRIKVQVTALKELAGQKVLVKEGARDLASGVLTAANGRVETSLTLPLPPLGQSYAPLIVTVDGRFLKTLNLADPRQVRAKAFMEQNLHFKPSVFSGVDFPSCDFDQPSLAEDLIGPYTISTTFYDASYQAVKTAEKPGRYGAVVQIKTEDGKILRRLRTLFRTPQRVNWWRSEISGTLELPKDTGIDPALASLQPESTGKYLKSLVGSSMRGDDWTHSWTPAFFSFLYELKPGEAPASLFDDFEARDRQWWVGLKRKLDGTEKRYATRFICPKPNPGKAAPVIRQGSLQEAGMKPEAADKIDAVLKEWEADTDEAFAVCIARHGVIVLHKAYGERKGKPMTVQTKSWAASITKCLSGTAMMMVIDKGDVKLDDPVSKFFPQFRTAGAPASLTIRHLFTHTGGFQGHWGDELHDYEDVIGAYSPYLEVGKRFEYDGAGLSLGCKVIESVTGEALPQFYKHHLLDPLGCTDTTVTNSSSDTSSTPMDLAKIGQMLLNKGSYGDKQFMRPETFEQMLPRRLTQELGPDATDEWGIGVVWYMGEGLGQGTFGHGAASAALFRVDPENDLVIVMTRNSAGKNMDKYQPRFLASIVENLQK